MERSDVLFIFIHGSGPRYRKQSRFAHAFDRQKLVANEPYHPFSSISQCQKTEKNRTIGFTKLFFGILSKNRYKTTKKIEKSVSASRHFSGHL